MRKKVVNTLTGEQKVYELEQCIHHKCLNHKPEWEEIGNSYYTSRNGLLKVYLSERCCGQFMRRVRIERHAQCTKCGSERVVVKHHYLALCMCCGRVVDKTPSEDY